MRCVYVLLAIGGITAAVCGAYMALTGMLTYAGMVWAVASLMCIYAYRIRKHLNEKNGMEDYDVRNEAVNFKKIPEP